jgi:hypothetical protein
MLTYADVCCRWHPDTWARYAVGGTEEEAAAIIEVLTLLALLV